MYGNLVRSVDRVDGFDHLLIMCRANQCRSPFAEAIARRLIADRAILVESGGLLPGGVGVPPLGIEVAREYGLDLSQHRSREIDVVELKGFDLILTASREQARDVVAARSDLRARVFTIKQFARWIQANPRPRRAELGSWLDTKAGDRSPAELIGSSSADDIEDPLLAPASTWRAVAEELEDALSVAINGLRAV